MKPTMKKPRSKVGGRMKNSNGSSTNDSIGNIYENSDYRHRNNGQRVNYQQMHDKYMNLAREALGEGDRVAAEFHYQYADHYLRLMRERQQAYVERRQRAETQEAAIVETPLENLQDSTGNKTRNAVEAIIGELTPA